jgi:hypothetical protein
MPIGRLMIQEECKSLTSIATFFELLIRVCHDVGGSSTYIV